MSKKDNFQMSKVQKKQLGKVSIGPLAVVPGVNVLVESKSTKVEKGTLYDQRMGKIFATTDRACAEDHIGCFGTLGYIPLPVPILNPAFESIMIQYLRLFRYQSSASGAFLEMKEGIRELINNNKSLVGYRRLSAISQGVSTSGGNWSVYPEGGGVKFKRGTDKPINITGQELKQLLQDATTRYTSDESIIHLDELGMNTKISKPENFVIEYIPVLPNTLRVPQQNQRPHAFTDLYADIIKAIHGEFKIKPTQEKQSKTREQEIRDAYLDLISKSDTMNLRDAVFTSSKDGFLRGHMYSKVGGQIARSVVVPDLQLKPYQVGIPRKHALDLSRRMEVTEENLPEIRRLIEENHITHIFDLRSKQYIRIDKIGESGKKLELEVGKQLVLRQLQDGDVVLANRQPTLHRNSLLAFEVVLHDDDVIRIHQSATTGLTF